MKLVGVIGAGVMGGGIAQAIAQAGFSVINVDSYPDSLTGARTRTQKNLQRLIDKQKMTGDQAREITARIVYSGDEASLADCDIVIEAVPEQLELKQKIFARLGEIVRPDTILATNTSALSISAIGAAAKLPERCIGLHFFCPATVMKLVEVISGVHTTPETEQLATQFVQAIGKTPARAQETPGFLVNRILVPMMNEAAFLVMEGAAPEDVDAAMKLGANLPMGPLELADFVGIDIMLATMRGLYEGFKDSKYRPCPLLENMVAAGRLGRKTRHGFYAYANQ